MRDDDSAVWWFYGFVDGMCKSDDCEWAMDQIRQAAASVTARIDAVRDLPADDIDDALAAKKLADQP